MSTNNRLVIVGLDGLSLTQAKFVAHEFGLKNIGYIANSTKCTTLISELPELSPVNWTSFFTGKGPEEHGVFGFVNIDPSTYKIYLTNYQSVKVKTIFQKLSEKNILMKVINLPNTYPAPQIKGVIVSGFVAKDLERGVYPQFFIPLFKDINYILEPDTIKGIKDPEYLISQLMLTLNSRKKAFELLWPDLAWDLFIFVITEIDRINHFLYPAIFDNKNMWHEVCRNFFKKIDEILGDILDRYYSLPEPKRLIVLADHGFSDLDVEVDINTILKQYGFLFLDGKSQNELDARVISAKSLAFALDPGRVYIHKKDIFKYGIVHQRDYNNILNELKELFKTITYNGKKVFKKIYTKEEIYPGTKHIDAPDILCLANKGFDLKAKFDRQEVFGIYGRFGTHFYKDAIFYDSENEDGIEKIRDVGKLILRHFKEKILG